MTKKSIIISMIFIFVILFFNFPIYAKNNVKNTNTSTKIALDSLEIEGYELEPNFNQNTYQYKIKLNGDKTKLDVKAVSKKANVKIIGNENLKDGQNAITIIVSDKNEDNVVTYQIIVEKNVIEQPKESETVLTENTVENTQLNPTENSMESIVRTIKANIIIVGVGILVLICLIIVIVVRRKKHKNDNKYEQDDEEYEVSYKKGGKHSK